MASEEYSLWDVYKARLEEAGLDPNVVREIIDMMVTQTVNDGRLKAALDAHELRIGEKIASVAANQEQTLKARISQAINLQTKWVVGSVFVAAGLIVAAT